MTRLRASWTRYDPLWSNMKARLTIEVEYGPEFSAATIRELLNEAYYYLIENDFLSPDDNQLALVNHSHTVEVHK